MTLLRTALLLGCAAAAPLAAQQLPNPGIPSAADSIALAPAMASLARVALAQFHADDRDVELNTRFRLQLVAGDTRVGLATLQSLRELRSRGDSVYAPSEYTQYEIAAESRLAAGASAEAEVARAFNHAMHRMSDRAAFRAGWSFGYDLGRSAADLERLLAPLRGTDSIPLPVAIALLRQYQIHTAYTLLLPYTEGLLAADDQRRYLIDDSVLVRTRDGASVSAIVVRPRAATGPQPAILSFTIYADGNNLVTAREMASNGYVGVVATTRGKRFSPGPIVPFEHDGSDASDVIDWISRQPWSNGTVGMLGGSYSGFTQWAAAMRLPPALKTIVPSAAIVPGFDMPTENGVFQSFQYPWIGYTTNTTLLDNASYRDGARWNALDSTWYASGRAYRTLDSIDGTPNPLFRRWIAHPGYDAYWQRLTPQGKQFSRITIPVLTTTGYFDGAQAAALQYYREHRRHNPRASHYLLIGPWDHFGSQGRPSPVISGYRIDPVARVDITAVIYQWYDHILKGAARPAILADKVNYQVMGTNQWRHAPSLAAMAPDTLSLYLRRAQREGARTLRTTAGPGSEAVSQEVDLTDRTRSTSNAIPGQLADTALDLTNGIAFVSEPLPDAVTINGAFTGMLRLVTNKSDFDVGVTLYEALPDGTWFHLSYFLGRASYAKDRTRRQLLVRGAVEAIPISNTRMISRVLGKGSRLVVVVNVNQDSESPVNYGSGKDVYTETIEDAGAPLQIEWRATSVVRVPVKR